LLSYIFLLNLQIALLVSVNRGDLYYGTSRALKGINKEIIYRESFQEYIIGKIIFKIRNK